MLPREKAQKPGLASEWQIQSAFLISELHSCKGDSHLNILQFCIIIIINDDYLVAVMIVTQNKGKFNILIGKWMYKTIETIRENKGFLEICPLVSRLCVSLNVTLQFQGHMNVYTHTHTYTHKQGEREGERERESERIYIYIHMNNRYGMELSVSLKFQLKILNWEHPMTNTTQHS